MSTENKLLCLSFVADEDLSNDQHRWVVLTSTGVRRPDSETEIGLGILQNAPVAGEAANVMIEGVSKLQMNAAVAVGVYVMPEYVDAADAGKGKTAVGAEEYARALVIEASGAEDDLASVLLISPRPAIAIAAAEIALAENKIIIGSAAGAGAAQTMSGDATLAANGALTLGADVVGGDHIPDNAISIEHLDDGILPAMICIGAGQFPTVGGDANESIAVAGMLGTDVALVQIMKPGAVARTIVSATAGVGAIAVVMSDDPSNDHILTYQVFRTAA